MALPSILKGSDMVVFEVFRSLGLKTSVHPVVDRINKHLGYISDEEFIAKFCTGDYIGKEFTGPINTGVRVETVDDVETAYTKYPSTRKNVTWINAPKTGTQAVQFGYMAVRPSPSLVRNFS
jgi:hypothetical protein